MTLWVCQRCGTPYAVDVPSCPHCGADEPAEQGTDLAKLASREERRAEMPKITVHGGAEPPEVDQPAPIESEIEIENEDAEESPAESEDDDDDLDR